MKTKVIGNVDVLLVKAKRIEWRNHACTYALVRHGKRVYATHSPNARYLAEGGPKLAASEALFHADAAGFAAKLEEVVWSGEDTTWLTVRMDGGPGTVRFHYMTPGVMITAPCQQSAAISNEEALELVAALQN